jgi:hypothetical protein
VTANFTHLPAQAEFGVLASVDAGAASTFTTSATAGVPSAASSAPIGGNAGAFAQGFTTAPDVQGM